MEYALVATIFLAFAAAGIVLHVRRNSGRSRQHRQFQRQLTKHHKSATLIHATAIKVAGRKVADARSSYQESITSLEDELRRLLRGADQRHPRASRPQQIDDCQRRLAAARNNTTSMKTADCALSEIRTDPGMLRTIEETQRALWFHAARAPQRNHPRR